MQGPLLLDGRLLWAKCLLWPSFGYFTTVIEVDFNCAESTISANFKSFLCMLFLVDLSLIKVFTKNTGGPLLTLFFETLEKQPCKQKTV